MSRTIPGDPDGMRAKAGELRVRAAELRGQVARVRDRCRSVRFEGPAARSFHWRMEEWQRSVLHIASGIEDVAANLRREAEAVEAAQHAEALRVARR